MPLNGRSLPLAAPDPNKSPWRAIFSAGLSKGVADGLRSHYQDATPDPLLLADQQMVG